MKYFSKEIRSGHLKTSQILSSVIRLLYPFILLYGIYIIINGHLSPGGGFQGGAILATAILTTYFVNPTKIRNLNLLIRFEKYAFMMILLLASLSIFTKGELFTNFLPLNSSVKVKSLFLIALNFFIGIKVSLGLVSIFSTFIEEGKQ